MQNFSYVKFYQLYAGQATVYKMWRRTAINFAGFLFSLSNFGIVTRLIGIPIILSHSSQQISEGEFNVPDFVSCANRLQHDYLHDCNR